MKRQLMSYVFQVVNYKKMRNLEDWFQFTIFAVWVLIEEL
jgi:hypothetical protein